MMTISILNKLKLLYGGIYVIDEWGKIVNATDKNLDRLHLAKNGIYAKLLDAKGNSICKSQLYLYDIENNTSNVVIDNYGYGWVISAMGRELGREIAILDKSVELKFRQKRGNWRNIGRIYEQNLDDINVEYKKKIGNEIQYCKIGVPVIEKRDAGIIYNGIDEYGVLVLDSDGIRCGIDNLRADEKLMYSLIGESDKFRRYIVHRVANICSVIKSVNVSRKDDIAILISRDAEIECTKSEKKSERDTLSKDIWYTKCNNVYKKMGDTFKVNYVNIHCEVDMVNSENNEVIVYHGDKNIFKKYSGSGCYELNILVDVNKNKVKIVDGRITDETYRIKIKDDNKIMVDNRGFEDVR